MQIPVYFDKPLAATAEEAYSFSGIRGWSIRHAREMVAWSLFASFRLNTKFKLRQTSRLRQNAREWSSHFILKCGLFRDRAE